jgi:hypothetical protein
MSLVDVSELRVIPKTIRELNQFSEQQVYEKLKAEFKLASLQVQVSGYLALMKRGFEMASVCSCGRSQGPANSFYWCSEAA